MPDPLPLGRDDALVVCGGMNRKPSDRFLPPARVHPVYVVTERGHEPCRWFDRYDPRTVPTLIPSPDGDGAIYCTEEQVYRLRTGATEPEPLDLGPTDDIHELTVDGDRLLVANTAYDEVIDYDLASSTVRQRHRFDAFRPDGVSPGDGALSDTFHVNQAVVDTSGHLLSVAHHTIGERVVAGPKRRRVRHGDGGVVDLTGGTVTNFGWQAPHSLRPHEDGWMVADSGRHELVTFSPSWDRRETWKTSGWPRGVDFDGDHKVMHVGVTATVKRYARIGDRAKTGIESVELATDRHWFLRFHDMEKIMWVQRCSPEFAGWLRALPPPG